MQNKTKVRLHRSVLRWYGKEGRDLPWRKTRKAYRILVSEIMLQQTQVSRVLEKYPLFLRHFPNMKRLARASRRDVIMAWRGMGYNNRAVRLHELARRIVKDHRGVVGSDFEALVRLPGIGRYTANAVLSFAHHRRVPVVDTNIRRVLSRILLPMKTSSDLADEKTIWEEAGKALPARKSSDWNHALMDLGAMICTARSPSCNRCPVNPVCRSAGKMLAADNHPVRAEPSFHGIPNRIYRGKLVELLRNTNPKQEIRLSSLGRKLHNRFGPEDFDWLRSLVEGLERDGLLRIRPGSSDATMRVRLP